ncbi:lipoyl(octanoyl) transferase LipB [Fusibacter sp. 3D3]|uniref:lipoyl(octanoyl) transferase LipB n=1 Tax=Fusibacter sp. 3D3 TaxID=1048380 RepID=UPI00085854D5|nr:lipoyl(octanoyl) transferase LipB [Fusibacter sp. 3D3]GAU77010.1 octanoate-[acyl-carrier-protein]-protein-N-octanoyltransferase [Fusibacter sp. 3D3]
MNLENNPKNLNQILRENTSILIREHFQYNALKDASDTLFDLFEKVSQLDVNDHTHNEAIYLDSGKAIGSYWAGRCMTEFMRTRLFLMGIQDGIKALQNQFPNETIHILYAGTGPFGTLVTPLTTLFTASEIQVTGLEINKESIQCFRNIIAAFHIEAYFQDIIQCDATQYQKKSSQIVHMIITETMLNGLQKEPQVAITRNLVPQMHPNGILIPQNISVSLNLVDKRAEMDRLFLENTVSKPFFLQVASLIELNQNNCTYDHIYHNIEVNLKGPIETRFNGISLFTTIQVFDHHVIEYNACSLTLPINLKTLTPATLLENKLVFNYKFGEHPKFEYKINAFSMNLNTHDLGLMDYTKAYTLQEHLLLEVQNGSDDHLLLLEHPKVITLGLNANDNNILIPQAELDALGFQVIKTRRGGDVTYHGPGQLVGYTIFNIKKNHGGSVKKFVYKLEQLFIQLLQDHYNIPAKRDPINSGVFVGNSKILALGLSVKKGVTMHGFALNVNTHLEDFDVIVPCGLKNHTVTSINQQCHGIIDMSILKTQIIQAFLSEFNYNQIINEK